MGREGELKLEVPPSANGRDRTLAVLSEIASGPVKHEKLVTVYCLIAASRPTRESALRGFSRACRDPSVH
jgi:hypothetical protein